MTLAEMGRALAVAVVAATAACDVNTPTYFPPSAPLVVGGVDEAGMQRATAATGTVTPGFRLPNDGERAALDAESGRLGFVAPWLRRSDLHFELLYTITNLDDKPGVAQVLVNGANEITNYDPERIREALRMGLPADEEPVVLPLIQGIPVMLGPGEKREGRLREDDFAEASLDLDALGRWMAPFAAVLINRSQVNPVGLDGVPSRVVVPALLRVAVTFTASRHMVCQYLLRVRDGAGRLGGAPGQQFEPLPADFSPAAPPRP